MDLEQFSSMPLEMGIKRDDEVACTVCSGRRDCGLVSGLCCLMDNSGSDMEAPT